VSSCVDRLVRVGFFFVVAWARFGLATIFGFPWYAFAARKMVRLCNISNDVLRMSVPKLGPFLASFVLSRVFVLDVCCVLRPFGH
jgi:hypothetical protein